MDEDGYVPLPLLCTYQNVAGFGAMYVDVVEKLQSLPSTSNIEFNATNETVRLKHDWEKVKETRLVIMLALSVLGDVDCLDSLVAHAEHHGWSRGASLREADA
jgi:hypothetical protein